MSRFDRWSKDGLTPGSAEWRRVQAGIDDVMRHVIASPHISRSASMVPPEPANATPRKPGGGTAPITSPPGINYIDQMCDAQDRQDRLTAIREANELREIERRLRDDRRDPYRAKTEYNPLAEYDRSIQSLHRRADGDDD